MSTWILLLAGFVLLAAGAEALVRGACTVAVRRDMGTLAAGLTLVGFAAAAPALAIGLAATLQGSPDIALGGMVGSAIANILLVLGLTAAVAPVAVDGRAFRRDGTALALATVVAAAFIAHGFVGRLFGLILVTGLITYGLVTYAQERAEADSEGHRLADAAASRAINLDVVPALGLAGFGLLLLIVGAKLLVDGSIGLAAGLGISEALVGLSVAGIGASLPLLTTALPAAMRGHNEAALGAVVSANLYILLGALGLTALVSPLAVPPEIARIDVWVMAAATAVLLVFARTGLGVSRHEGANLLLLWFAWLLVLYVRATGLPALF